MTSCSLVAAAAVVVVEDRVESRHDKAGDRPETCKDRLYSNDHRTPNIENIVNETVDPMFS